jgi:hypothetical protein
MPGNCPASLCPLAAGLWKTFRSKPNAIPLGDSKLFAFPPELVFIFRPECCSESQRNGVRLQTGIAFAFDRIPQQSPLRARQMQQRRRESEKT